MSKKPDEAQDLLLEIPEAPPAQAEGSAPPTSPGPRMKTRSQTAAANKPAIEMDLGVLLKFIKPYDGNRETLNSFLTNCNNAYDLATASQKDILFKYILCQLQGKAETACSIKEFSNWDQLRSFLKTQFSERKHYAHLLMDLQESKQAPNENVSQFALKVGTYLSQLLAEIQLSTSKQKELPGRTAAMEDLALHHFLMGLQPRISNIVRCQAPKSLNEAINLAISEERIQQSIYKRTSSQPEPKNSQPNNGKRFPQNKQVGQQTSGTQSNPNNSSGLFCRYCRNPGHDIKDCRKRQFSNNRSREQTSQGPAGPGPSQQLPRRVNHIQEILEEEEDQGRDEVDETLNE